MNKTRLKFRTILLMIAGVAMAAPHGACFGQTDEPQNNDVRQMQILLRTEGLDIVSPELKSGTHDVMKNPMLPPYSRPPMTGRSPGFRPPMLMQQNRIQQHQGQEPQIHRPEIHRPEIHPPGVHPPEAHQPEGPFAEDHKRIAALTESAERLAQAGMPDLAHELRERAGHMERELAEKRERMQREQAIARMREQQEKALQEQKEKAREQQRLEQITVRRLASETQAHAREQQHREEIQHGDRPDMPIRELQQQMEQLRRDLHKLSQQMERMTDMLQERHEPEADHRRRNDRDADEHEREYRDDD